MYKNKIKKIISWEMSHENLVGFFIAFLGVMTFVNITRSYKSISRSLKKNVMPDDSVFETSITGLINQIEIQDAVFTMELLILVLFSVALVAVYILIFYGTIKFLLSYSSNVFSFSKKSVRYLKILGNSLAAYTLLLIASKYVFLKVGIAENFMEMIKTYNISAYSDFVLISSFFVLIFANLVSRSFELEKESEGTI